MTFTRALSTNNYGPAKFVVDGTTVANGTHSTIAAALTSASSGDTIFIRPGTFSENLSLKAGVNLTAFGSDSSQNGTGKVIISGTCTLTTAGSVTISGIQLQTNSAALLAVTGSAASIVNLENCYLNMTNNSGITFSSSSGSAAINIKNCKGDLGTTGILIFAHSSAGVLTFQNSIINNSGASTSASTVSAGTLSLFYSILSNPVTSSGTSAVGMSYSGVDSSGINTACLTCGGSGSHTINSSSFSSGTASAISISSTAYVTNCYLNSTNTNAITGAGTLNYNNLAFVYSSSAKINTTTQLGGVAAGGQTQAPTAGFLGQQLTANATSVATTSATPKTITSISLTPGIWDITGMSFATATGGTALMTTHATGISTTDNVLTGSGGINFQQSNVADSTKSNTIATTRATLTANTVYYLVVLNVYTSTTCPTNALITATRVG